MRNAGGIGGIGRIVGLRPRTKNSPKAPSRNPGPSLEAKKLPKTGRINEN